MRRRPRKSERRPADRVYPKLQSQTPSGFFRATVGTLRLKLLKVAARVTVSVRRVYLQLSSAYPRPDLFRLCHARLMQLTPADG